MSKEIEEILKAVDHLAAGERAVLATVVDLKGSGYRLPGARMLIAANGDAFGIISGGCLEADVMERAKRVLASGVSEVFTYDTGGDENSVFSMNMGCRGVLQLLIEPVDKTSPIIDAFKRVAEHRCRIETATIIGIEAAPGVDDVSQHIGSRVMVDERDGKLIAGSDAYPEWLNILHDDLMTFADASAHNQIIKYEMGDYLVDVCFETLRPPVRLVIFGAGADAVPLANAAHLLGWTTEIYDHRPAFLTAERFPHSRLHSIARDAVPDVKLDELTAVMMMNHNYDRDRDLLPVAMSSGAFYVGVLGPKRRTEQMLGEIDAKFTDEQMAVMRSPAGLDIGADTPESIAVSIIAEIQSVLKHRLGGPLREREGSIYDRK